MKRPICPTCSSKIPNFDTDDEYGMIILTRKAWIIGIIIFCFGLISGMLLTFI